MRWEITKAEVIFSLIYQPCSLLHSEMATQGLTFEFNKCCLFVWGFGESHCCGCSLKPFRLKYLSVTSFMYLLPYSINTCINSVNCSVCF